MPIPGAAPEFWSVPLEELFESLGSSPTGLSVQEATERRREFGPNVAVSPRRRGGPRILLDQFRSPVTLLLLVAAILSMALGERTDGAIITLIVVVSGILGFWQERRAAGEVAALLALVRSTATVVRGGADVELPVEEVTPGDIVRLAAGANVPGDARIVDSRDLFVDEAALTGESFPAEKGPATSAASTPLAQRSGVLHAGTHVVSGTATALVVRTGTSTQFGGIARRLALHPPETAFERGVRHFGYLLLEVALVLTVIIFAINVALDRPVIDALLFTLALAVGLTPQLLPAIVSVTLARGAHRMARERVIVRRLASIQDLGAMSVLCTDKTGTLTEGVVRVHAVEDPLGRPSAKALLYAHLNACFESGFANPIDTALRALPQADAGAYRKLDEIPYDFIRKRLSVVADHDGVRILITKGAFENVLETCTDAEDGAGARLPIGEVADTLRTRFSRFGADGYRCLGVAWRALAPDESVTRESERGMTFLGLVSLEDPLKPSAATALEELRQLNVTLKLITGDNRLVAARTAHLAGLDPGEVVTGGALRSMSDAALVSIAPRTSVFAEVEPNQKERIIVALRKAGLAVGFLGDGINDAPALHAADVGISVESATDVTRQAADIVLLDKDLGALGRGVREGRRAFGNTLKYIYITISANFGNMFSMAAASLVTPFLPLLPAQILLINVLTDLPAMAIATDRLDPELARRPRRWSNRDIARFMVAFGLVSSAFDVLTFGTLLHRHVSPAVFRTGWFIESVLSELLVLLVIRTRRAFFRSLPGAGLVVSSVAVATATLLLPWSPLAAPMGLTPLPLDVALLMAGIVILYVAASEGTKRLVFRSATL